MACKILDNLPNQRRDGLTRLAPFDREIAAKPEELTNLEAEFDKLKDTL